ncbi:MAG: hypothetical protein ACD_80C00142G0023 [uncultured bacterium (gcode 4)]|uniref:Uncharacterized protein n=1 Tax=uncultured bacterium (gcode 4) TaxID=1234023 RepID=K1XID1_9BACT|nr:MAG: hypothetical protein ACD_80C00142G0023 [uncultured bacterium (gcode 4)]
MYVFKIVTFVTLGLLSMLGMISFAADPSFSITPSSLTGKLHCGYTFGMILNPAGINYNGFSSTIKFDSGNVSLRGMTFNPIFAGPHTSYITDWYLYEAYGLMSAWQSSNTTLQALTFGFTTLQNITSTNLFLTTRTWAAISYGLYTTADGAVINRFLDSFDILTWVNDGAYTFVALPCIPDGESPLMWRNTPINGERYIPSNHTISFVLYDWAGPGVVASPLPMNNSNNRQHYRYSGNAIALPNYVPAPVTVDNQEWVNSGTIQVSVACPTCTLSAPWTNTYLPGNSSMTIVWRTGNITYNKLTRQNKTRGYVVSIASPSPNGYEIEKQINVNINVTDNPNENNATHLWVHSFSFNAPEAPVITRIAPIMPLVPTTFSPFIFTFTDDRAGINTWTMNITIPQFSSWSKSYTWYTYSGTDFTITLISGLPGAWNSWSYQVSFVPKRVFPSNSILQITWSVYDLAGNLWLYTSSFTTAKSCLDWWCADFFTVNILSGTSIWARSFTWNLIQVTWTNINSPYPYLTGINNDILMCGRPYSWTILTWNIWIFSTTWSQINGILYTWSQIYITGMDGIDFVYNNGVIVIIQ